MNFPSPHDRILPDKIRYKSPPSANEQQDEQQRDRIQGCLLGLAVGDALGASVEFRPHSYLKAHPVERIQSGGTWGLKKGQWTDDTSMALCLAASLITMKKFDPYNQMVCYKWWHKHGFLSSTGHCFDIGTATRDALDQFWNRQKELMKACSARTEAEVDKLTFDEVRAKLPTFDCYCGKTTAAGNGALMRLAPVPLFFFRNPHLAVRYSGESARLTHGDKKAIDACRYYAALIAAAVLGESFDQLTSPEFYDQHKQWFGSHDLHPEVLGIAKGSYQAHGGYDQGIRGKGYVINSLEAALWAFWKHKDSPKDGFLAAVNLGDDTDTTAAIYGQLAGAYFGVHQIPREFSQDLYARNFIIDIASWLHVEGGAYQSAVAEQHQRPSNNHSNQQNNAMGNRIIQQSQSSSTASASAEHLQRSN